MFIPTERTTMSQFIEHRYIITSDWAREYLSALFTTQLQGCSIQGLLQNDSDYFISCRVWPFNLNDVFGRGTAEGIEVGRKTLESPYTATLAGNSKLFTIGRCNHSDDDIDLVKLNSKINLYIPFVGFTEILPEQFYERDLLIKATCEFDTGKIEVYIIDNTDINNQYVVKSLSGNVGVDMIVSATNKDQILRNNLGNWYNMLGVASMNKKISREGYNKSVMQLFSDNVVSNTNMGTSEGMNNLQMPNKVYSVIEKRDLAVPRDTNYKRINGIPCGKILELSQLVGYTEIEDLHIDNFIGTDAERVELEEILKSGVIL